MSNIADPQCSSGVESGWTTYLDDHNDNNERINLIDGSYGYRSWSRKEENDDNNYDNDENLSMVSDASSGPPYYEAEDWRGRHVSRGGFLAGSGNKRQQQSGGRYSGCYEDTACSSRQKNFSPPANNYPPSRHPFDFNQAYSIANLEGRFESANHYNNVQTPVADKRAASKKHAGRSRKLV